ncbi:MAG: hypothetical protein M3Q99_05705 [Acidobacteriota bacterium]|nr:hypothetical protein [Acidobacteriota bacterium]
MKVKRFFMITLIAAMFAVTFSSFAMAQNIVVTPTNTQGWSTADTRPGGAVNFVVDATAPAGNGALQLTTDATTAAKAQYLHAANTPLANVTELSYWTKQVSGPPHADPSYQLPVCLGGFNSPVTITNPSGCTGFTTFVFEPYQNNGSVAPSPLVVPNVWQQWDVDAGQFWSSRTVNAGGACVVTAGFGGPPFYSLSQLQSNCPSAVVVAFGVNIGTFNPSYDVYTDLVRFNNTTYDFEPYLVATNKDQCKNGGFNDVKRADGSSFKNQGDCIQFVNTGN